jgi:predicted O-linked N-acetylglucosamine transferase (SPINDLY family)
MATKPPAPANAAAWNTAVAHHQAGRLKEAEALYRQILAASPQHFEAKHLLGVVALQTGRLDDAASLIQEALVLNPKLAAAHNNLGNVRLRQGRDTDATAAFQKAVQIQPSYGDAHYNLANLLRKAGKLKEASTHFLRATGANAKWFEAHQNLGATLLDLGDARGAAKAFEAAARLKPDSADAWSNLGAAWAEAGEMPRALDALAKALKIAPKSADVLANQGGVLARMGRLAEARQSLDQALQLQPGHPVAHTNLGNLLRDTNQPADAIVHFEAALKQAPQMVAARIGLSLSLQAAGRDKEAAAVSDSLQQGHPNSPEALVLQGRLCLAKKDHAGAEKALAAALAADPANAEAHYLLGNVLMLGGRWKEAVESYQRAVNADANDVRARWSLVMAQVPPVFADAAQVPKARSNFTRMLADLDKWFDAQRTPQGHAAVGSTQPFYLPYQAVSNRELLQKYGALCSRLMAPWQQGNGLALPPVAASSGKLRVGIVSAHISDHSVWNAVVKGWTRNLDKSRFELYLYHLGGQGDSQTEQARQWAHRLEAGSRDAAQWARLILDHRIDVLIYPEIGMDSTTVRLASMRLAPVQAASWGHPETTGLPTIDHYLSAEDLEPADAQKHYTEKLVALPRLGVCYEPMSVTPVMPDLAALGLPQDQPLLLCPGMPFKYAPAQDRVWSEIAKHAPHAHLVYFQKKDNELGAQLATRLERQFKDAGLDFRQRVSFLPFLDRERFYGLMRRAHLFLDTIGFSGFNTAMQAVECGLPIVTREGEFMRGRLASGILRRMGMDELVTTSDDAYIELAVALANDLSRRNELAGQITQKRQALFGDLTPVRALEDFLLKARAA